MAEETDRDSPVGETLEASSMAGAYAVSPPPLGDGLPARIGRYPVRRRLGAGGMGTVFEAHDLELDRAVAIKVVHRGGAAGQERLLREAQALARVSHPNVVPVFEVGTHRDAVYIAMEFVDGETLGDWIARNEPPLPALLEIFARAGEGLAAAHAAGLVHRDFKPDNVMVGRDGRVRVMDFGLVRGTGDASARGDDFDPLPPIEAGDQGSTLTDSLRPEASTGPFHQTLTRAGAVLGTPAYMSPEQFQRKDVGPKSDQFSFCVALYEALYGERPFAGGNMVALARAVVEGELRPAPPGASVPGWLRQRIVRGLSVDPEARWSDMPALLSAIADDPRSRRRRALGLGAGVVALAGLATLALTPRPSTAPSCDGGAARVAAIWGPAKASALREGLGDTAPAYASAAIDAAASVLDRYAAELAAADDALCRGYHLEHSVSDQAFDLRRACLDGGRDALEGVVGELYLGESGTLERVDALLGTLPQLASCTDATLLRASAPPPAGLAEEVADLRGTLASLRAQGAAGRVAQLEAELDGLRTRAEATGYLPLVAEVALEQARFGGELGGDARFDAAHAALEAAVRSGDPSLEARATIALARTATGADGERVQIARQRWLELADARIDHLGSPPQLELDWLDATVELTSSAAPYEVTIERLERQRALIEAATQAPDVRRGDIYAALAEAHAAHNRAEPALEFAARARGEYDETIGPDHPRMGRLYLAAARAAVAGGHFETQRDLLRRAREVYVAAYGPTSSAVIHILDVLAISYDLEGDRDRARALLEEALDLRGERHAARTTGGFEALNSLCFIDYKLGELDRAEAACRAAIDNADAFYPKLHPARAIALNNLALIARGRGDHAAALELDRRALQIARDTVGPDHVITAYGHVGLGESLLALGRPAEATEALEAALAIRKEVDAEPGEAAEARCLLAEALPRGAEARALELATSGLRELEAAGPNWSAQADRCRRWLLAKGRPAKTPPG